jgi:hypothetical protein
MPLTLPAIRLVQQGLAMYLVALPIKELDLCNIDRWDPKRILRGGSTNDLSKYARCAIRGRTAPGDSINHYGFRVALSQPN